MNVNKKYRFKTGDIIFSGIPDFRYFYLNIFSKYVHSALIICIFDKVYVFRRIY